MTEILDDTKGLIPIQKQNNNSYKVLFGILTTFFVCINLVLVLMINHSTEEWLMIVVYAIIYVVAVIPFTLSLYMIFIMSFSLTALLLKKLRLQKFSLPFKYLVEKGGFLEFFLLSELIITCCLSYMAFNL